MSVWTVLQLSKWTALAALLGLFALRADAGILLAQPVADRAQLLSTQTLSGVEESDPIRVTIKGHGADPLIWVDGVFKKSPVEFYLPDHSNVKVDPWMPGWTAIQSGSQQDEQQVATSPKAGPDAESGRAGAIPLPNAAWSGLTCLVGLTLAGGVRRLYQSFR